jgi:hypothetical protein
MFHSGNVRNSFLGDHEAAPSNSNSKTIYKSIGTSAHYLNRTQAHQPPSQSNKIIKLATGVQHHVASKQQSRPQKVLTLPYVLLLAVRLQASTTNRQRVIHMKRNRAMWTNSPSNNSRKPAFCPT